MALLLLPSNRLVRSTDRFNASTSDISFGTKPQYAAAHSAMVLVFQFGLCQGTLGYVMSRSTSGGLGRRLISQDQSGISRWVVGFASSGAAGNPGVTFNNTSSPWKVWQHFAYTFDGGILAAGIEAYSGVNGARLEALANTVPVDGATTPGDDSANNFHLGNREGGSRCYNGLIAIAAEWNRVLSADELRYAQMEGPLMVPNGLTFCWAGGRDWGPFGLAPTSRVAILPDNSVEFAVFGVRRPRIWAVSSAAVNPLTLSATQGSAATAVRSVNAARAASQAASAVVARAVASSKLAMQASSASVARSIAAARSAAQAASPSAARQVGATRSTAQGAGAAATRQITWARAVTQASSAAIIAIKVKLLALAAIAGSAATLQRSVGAVRTASQATSASVTRAIAVVRAAAQASTASAARGIGKALAAAQGAAAAIAWVAGGVATLVEDARYRIALQARGWIVQLGRAWAVVLQRIWTIRK